MRETSIPAVVRERTSLQTNDISFTFPDYEEDWDGVARSLTWSQLYRRVVNLASQLRLHGSTGDRAVILAPQGLDYIAAFLGALQAGLIAVPLSAPMGDNSCTVCTAHCSSPSIACRSTGSPDRGGRCPRGADTAGGAGARSRTGTPAPR